MRMYFNPSAIDAIKVSNERIICPFGEAFDASNGNYFIFVRLKETNKWECTEEFRSLQVARDHAQYAAYLFGFEYSEDIKELNLPDYDMTKFY